LPTLNEISDHLEIGVSRLREQMEVARSLGFIDVRPRTGIRRLPYSFLPAVQQSLGYAIAIDRRYFEQYSDLRNHVEAAYWHKAVPSLTAEDHQTLNDLIRQAWGKLRGEPIRIPHQEHRELHLTLFRRLENPFVHGILEAYWDAYEAVGLNLYADYRYLEKVWNFHEQMVEAICEGNFDAGYLALVEHKDLIFHRPRSVQSDDGGPVTLTVDISE
jgi:DNA-binding FadR family transcriptional regulator